MSNNNEYPVVFKGEGLKNLQEIAKMYGTSEGEVVVKALKLLKVIQEKGNGNITMKYGSEEITVNTNKL